MRKRILSFLATAGLALVLAPAAFAVPPEMVDAEPIDMPEYVEPAEADPAVIDEPSAQALTTLEGSGTEDDPILIYDVEDFVDVVNNYTDDYYGDLSFKLMGNLDLSDPAAASIRPTEWGSYMTYLSGNFDGNGKTISGIPENCFLVMAWHKGEIKNLTVEMNGNAATLVYSSFTVNGAHGTTAMRNVTVTSSAPIQLESNDQANYAPFLFCTGPYFTMEDCVNYADITGPTYASVFYGYYPLPANGYPTDADVQIKNCKNHGNVTLRYAGLVFGNPSGLKESRKITITGLENYGTICGTESAHYFSSDAGGTAYKYNSYFIDNEKALKDSGKMTLRCEDVDCGHRGQTGELIDGIELRGLSISVAPNNAYKIEAPVNRPVDHYTVTVYRYVNIFDSEDIWQGTDRISYTERIEGDEELLETKTIFDYLLKDGDQLGDAEIWPWLPNEDEEDDEKVFAYKMYDEDGNLIGYWLDNSKAVSTEDFYYYINKNQTAGEAQWEVYVSAYDKDDQLLGTAALIR